MTPNELQTWRERVRLTQQQLGSKAPDELVRNVAQAFVAWELK